MFPTVKNADSSRVVPISSGTWDADPSATVASGADGSRPPSTTGIINSAGSSLAATSTPTSAAARTSSVAGTRSSACLVSGTPRWAASSSARAEARSAV